MPPSAPPASANCHPERRRRISNMLGGARLCGGSRDHERSRLPPLRRNSVLCGHAARCQLQDVSREHDYFVYILTDKGRKTLYIGMTNNLELRVAQHRNPERASFSQHYHCILLAYYEHYRDVN